MSDRRTINVGGRVFTVLFPDLVPPLSEQERDDLRESIIRRGVVNAVVVDEADGIIDGINRLEILAEVGATRFDDLVCPLEVKRGLSHDEKEATALDLNTARRQMTRDEITAAKSSRQKRAEVTTLLKRHTDWSNSKIAEIVGVHNQTVANIRLQLESTSEIRKSEVRVGKDGRATETTAIGKKPASDDPPPLPQAVEDDAENDPLAITNDPEPNGHRDDELAPPGRADTRHAEPTDDELDGYQPENDGSDPYDDPDASADDLADDDEPDERHVEPDDGADLNAAESRNDFVTAVNEVLTDDDCDQAANDDKAGREQARERSAARDARRVEALEQAAATAPASQDWRIILGDCVYAMDEIEAGSVRLAFSDSPYNIGWDYGDGADSDRQERSKFVNWCDSWMTGILRTLTPDGSFWCLINDEFAAEIKVRAEHVGFHLRQWLIWYESFGVNCPTKFNRTHRHLFWFVVNPSFFTFNADAVKRPSDRQEKYGDPRAAQGGKTWDSVWGINPVINRVAGTHAEAVPDSPAPVLPQALLRPIVACASDPGDLVLDPFCGNGTLGIAALALGRRFVGIEKRPEIHAIGERQIKAALARLNTQPKE